MKRAMWLLGACVASLVLLGSRGAAAEDKDKKDKWGPAWTAFTNILAPGRRARCETALCLGGVDDTWFAIEPLVELPIGKTFAVPVHRPNEGGTLGRWIDTHDLSVSFAGGLRFWFVYDVVSVATYFSQPLTNGTGFIHVPGSDFQYPVSSVRRPYPGFALGILGDTLWLGVDYQELVNGDSNGNIDRRYAPSAVVSRSWSITVGLATVNTVRWGLGTLAAKKANRTSKDLVTTLVNGAKDAVADATTAVTAADTAAKSVEAAGDKADALKTACASTMGPLELAKAKLETARTKVARAKDKVEDARLVSLWNEDVDDHDPKLSANEKTVDDLGKQLDGAAKVVADKCPKP